jgi:hypothetical protein
VRFRRRHADFLGIEEQTSYFLWYMMDLANAAGSSG